MLEKKVEITHNIVLINEITHHIGNYKEEPVLGAY